MERTGQLRYEFSREGRDFSVDLLGYLNNSQAGKISTFLYEEAFGVRDRLHWFIHMRSPHDYQELLEMVDHDSDFQEISDSDRLPEEKGGGNWERMFVPQTLRERIICPQHGMGEPEEGDAPPERYFVDPARCQTGQPTSEQLNTATAGAIVMRDVDVRYELRKEARNFAFEWQESINERLAGYATVLLYEETFGRQDRITWLIHLRELDDYSRITELTRNDPAFAKLFSEQRVPNRKGGGNWGSLFVDGSMSDTVLVPYLHSDS
ncbi:hypothetical protein J2S53_003484 [Actinopolyspora lacussalsi]|nr:hypothetical protein [Actinopolyspora lacussalsi]